MCDAVPLVVLLLILCCLPACVLRSFGDNPEKYIRIGRSALTLGNYVDNPPGNVGTCVCYVPSREALMVEPSKHVYCTHISHVCGSHMSVCLFFLLLQLQGCRTPNSLESGTPKTLQHCWRLSDTVRIWSDMLAGCLCSVVLQLFCIVSVWTSAPLELDTEKWGQSVYVCFALLCRAVLPIQNKTQQVHLTATPRRLSSW